MLFHWFVVESTKTPELKERLEAIGDIVVERLVAQGFDERASHAVFDDLVERYTREGWDFRRKPHLRESGCPQEEGRVDQGGDPIDEGGAVAQRVVEAWESHDAVERVFRHRCR